MQQKRKASAQANGSAKLPVHGWAISGHGALWTRHEKLLNSLVLFYFAPAKKATTKLQQQQSLHLPAEVPLKRPGNGEGEQQQGQNIKKAQHSTECTRKDEKLKMEIILYVMRVGSVCWTRKESFYRGWCVWVCVANNASLSLIKLLLSDKVEQLVEFVSTSEKMTALVCFTGRDKQDSRKKSRRTLEEVNREDLHGFLLR